MSALRVPDHFPRAKGCPHEAAALFTCLHEHAAQTPDEIFDGGATGEPKLSARAHAQSGRLLGVYNGCMQSALSKYPQRLERVNEAYRRTYGASGTGAALKVGAEHGPPAATE